VQSIIRELRGEKIDIIQYSEDPVIFATNALSPAKISRVTIADPAERQLEVVVDDSQLSLAIGKKGQNVRLGAKLLGWRIDIKSEEEKRQEVETEMAALVVPGAPVSVLMDHGLSEKLVEKLTIAGVATVEKLGSMTPEQLEEISGIGPKMVEKIQTAVVNYYGQFEAAMGEGGELPAPTGGSPADAAPAGEAVADAAPAGEAVADAAPAGEAVADAAPAGETVADAASAGEAVADATPAGEAVADAASAGEAVADAAPAGEEATVDAVSDDGVSQEAADENTVVEEIAAGGAEPLPESRETESDTIGESDRTV
jgi:N utilization substance protein A